jgi:hypothetical protein
MTGDHDHRDVRIKLADANQHIQTPYPRQDQIYGDKIV